MKVSVVRIGNSRGIRIPKTILDQCRVTDAMEIDSPAFTGGVLN
jgi:antitoxin component of MazEF toxin-antitoxin module